MLKVSQLISENVTLGRLCRAFLVSVVIGSPFAAAGDATIMEKLAGDWVSKGPAFFKPGSAELSISPTLDGSFYRLTYHAQNTNGETVSFNFSGEAMYRPSGDGGFTGSWADSFGDLLPIVATSDEASLVATWGTPDTKLGRTTYVLQDGGTLKVIDELYESDAWTTFNEMQFTRNDAQESNRLVSGIGGIFFRGDNPATLTSWYLENFEIAGPPSSMEELPWWQESGYTIFSPFPQDSEYFGNPDKKWMLNFRVRDLDTLVKQLRDKGIEVGETIELPYGRFARLADPEGNPIELWEPVE